MEATTRGNDNENNNVIRFINSFLYRGQYGNDCNSYRCIIMDFVGPMTLRDAMCDKLITEFNTSFNGAYTIREVMKDILHAITFIHSLNITHRDIKPENIICRVHNHRICRVVLADFGCSKMLPYNSNKNHILQRGGNKEMPGQLKNTATSSFDYMPSNPVVCTRYYRSPELLFGSSYSVLASDIFSIGM